MKHIVIEKKLVMDAETHGNCKAVYCISTGKIYASEKEAAADIGTSHDNISLCCRGKTTRAKGMKFCFVSELSSHIMEIAQETERLKAMEQQIRADVEREYQAKIDKIKSILA